mmetsp:Transcript_110/g.414  ORF Transcript_110/g.414 Transcript_110/m.414 type:complete len:503 (-) Transcript_110:265-1773(-)
MPHALFSVAQLLQNSCPHRRQWCFRRVMVNSRRQLLQSCAESSSIHWLRGIGVGIARACPAAAAWARRPATPTLTSAPVECDHVSSSVLGRDVLGCEGAPALAGFFASAFFALAPARSVITPVSTVIGRRAVGGARCSSRSFALVAADSWSCTRVSSDVIDSCRATRVARSAAEASCCRTSSLRAAVSCACRLCSCSALSFTLRSYLVDTASSSRFTPAWRSVSSATCCCILLACSSADTCACTAASFSSRRRSMVACSSFRSSSKALAGTVPVSTCACHASTSAAEMPSSPPGGGIGAPVSTPAVDVRPIPVSWLRRSSSPSVPRPPPAVRPASSTSFSACFVSERTEFSAAMSSTRRRMFTRFLSTTSTRCRAAASLRPFPDRYSCFSVEFRPSASAILTISLSPLSLRWLKERSSESKVLLWSSSSVMASALLMRLWSSDRLWIDLFLITAPQIMMASWSPRFAYDTLSVTSVVVREHSAASGSTEVDSSRSRMRSVVT